MLALSGFHHSFSIVRRKLGSMGGGREKTRFELELIEKVV
jgi:hypothetical protein